MSRFLKTAEIVHVFADTSGRVLGSIIEIADEKENFIRIEARGTKEEEEESPNWPEFTNMINGIEEQG